MHNPQQVHGLSLLFPGWTDRNPNPGKSLMWLPSCLSVKNILSSRRPFNAIEPRCFNSVLYSSIRSSVITANPFFFLYLLRTHCTLSRYSWVLLSGSFAFQPTSNFMFTTSHTKWPPFWKLCWSPFGLFTASTLSIQYTVWTENKPNKRRTLLRQHHILLCTRWSCPLH